MNIIRDIIIKKEEMRFKFDSDEIEKVTGYIKCCNRLNNANIFLNKFPFIDRIKIDFNDNNINFNIKYIKDDADIDQFLHLYRPIFLNGGDDPYSFDKIKAIISSKNNKNKDITADYRINLFLKSIKYLYNSIDYQQFFNIADEIYWFHLDTINDWIYGYEYHCNSHKKNKLSILYNFIEDNNLFRNFFISQLRNRICAIYKLCDFWEFLFNDEKTMFDCRTDFFKSKWKI